MKTLAVWLHCAERNRKAWRGCCEAISTGSRSRRSRKNAAADIERHLRFEPVQARPVSTSYQIRKYVRRHRAAVAVGVALLMLLASFVGLQAFELRRITR